MNRNYLKSLPQYFSIKKAYKINNVLKLKYIISEINIKLEYSEIKKIFNEDKLEKTYYFINKRFRPKIIREKMPKTHFYSKNFYEKGNKILSQNVLEEEIIKYAQKNKYFVFEKSILKYNSKIFGKILNKCKIKLQEYTNKNEKIEKFIDEFDNNNYYKLFINAFECSKLFINFKNAFISKIDAKCIDIYVSTYDVESDSEKSEESNDESKYKHDLLYYKKKHNFKIDDDEDEIEYLLDLHLNFFPFKKKNKIGDKNLMNNFDEYLLKIYNIFFGYNFKLSNDNNNLFEIYFSNYDESKHFKKINKMPIFKIN